MQKARRHTALASMVLRPLVGVWFQVHCPPLVGVLPIFRSRYCFAIGHRRVLSLAGWAPQIQTDFHVFGPTQVPEQILPLPLTGLSPSTVVHSRTLQLGYLELYIRSYNPGGASPTGLG